MVSQSPARKMPQRRRTGRARRALPLRPSITALALAVVVALTLAPSAGAVIRINRGISGISHGDTKKQVQRKLGRPSDVERERRETTWFYVRKQLVVTFKNRTGRVVFLNSDNPRERTASGDGIGSTEAEVVAGVPGIECDTDRGNRFCAVFGAVASTFFWMEAGRVSYVNMIR